MELYIVTENYIKYLRNIDDKVLTNHFSTHNRKYLGVGIKLNGYDYFIPLSSPDKSDYLPNGDIRKSIVPIIRLVRKDGVFYGKLLFNNMIPVPSSELSYYDVGKESDEKYRNIVLNQLRLLKKIEKKIVKNAMTIYNQKCKNLDIGYLKSTVDFKQLEHAYNLWVNNQET